MKPKDREIQGREPSLEGDGIDIRRLGVKTLQKMDKATADRLVRKAGKRARWYWYAFLGWSLSIAALAIFTPVDVLDRWPWAATFVKKMTEWFPFLGAHARHSRFPQVVSFVKSASFALLPLATATGLFLFWSHRRVALASLITGVRPTFLKPMTELLFLFVYALCLFGVWLIPGDPGFMAGFTTTNRFGLGFIDAIGFFFVALIPGMLALALYLRINSRHIPRHRS